MSEKRPYTYTVLRYVHDPLSAEFVNVGLVLFLPGDDRNSPVFRVETRKTIGRMRDMWRDLRRSNFISAMRAIDRALGRLGKNIASEGFLRSDGNALTIATKALPRDDSSLQWSPLGSGLTADPQDTFQKLYVRYVTQYDVRQTHRKTDEEVWRPVRAKLEERHIELELQPKVIRGGDDEIVFQHAWKNGAWHVYQPLSLDLADADNIYSKAHRWLGQLTSLSHDNAEPFQPHFIVGAPSDRHLAPAYERAIRILQKAPLEVEVYEETEIDRLVDQIEDELRSHRSATP